MKTHVINIKNMSGPWENVSLARHAVVSATDAGRVAAINSLEAAHGVVASFNLNEAGDFIITRQWSDEGWAKYQALGPIDTTGYIESGMEVSETVS